LERRLFDALPANAGCYFPVPAGWLFLSVQLSRSGSRCYARLCSGHSRKSPMQQAEIEASASTFGNSLFASSLFTSDDSGDPGPTGISAYRPSNRLFAEVPVLALIALVHTGLRGIHIGRRRHDHLIAGLPVSPRRWYPRSAWRRRGARTRKSSGRCSSGSRPSPAECLPDR
jgi:hypothetical protein